MDPFLNKINPRNLIPHEENLKIYGEPKFDDEFLESVKRQILNPIQVTTSNVIISGHRRCAAAIHLGIGEVFVLVRCDITDDLEIRQALLDANLHREKTNEERSREAKARKELASERAKKRFGGRKADDGETGPAREVAGREMGMSGASVDRAVEAVDAIDQALEEGDIETADKIREELNSKGINAGAKAAKKSKAKPEPQQKPKVKPHPTDEKVGEWRKPFSGLVRKIGELKTEFKSLANNEGGRFVTDVAKQEFESAASQLQEIVKHSQPTKHKSCLGGGCEGCEGQGFVRES